MLICVFISLFQCTQAEAQLQASEKRLAEILEKEAGNLQEGSSFVHCYSFLQCNTVSNTYAILTCCSCIGSKKGVSCHLSLA